MNKPNRMREILDQRLPAPAEIGYDARHGARRRRRRMHMAKGTLIAAMNIGADHLRLVLEHYVRGA